MVKDDPLWYKDAIIYEMHVKAFYDSNGDGVGDFCGLTEKLDYIQDLGVNTLWLLPFYPSPMRDDGYDISDYHNVNPEYGSMADFRQFVRSAHRRGLKVITELVINHTSDQHPWFQAARLAHPGSAKRNYYVWSDTDKKYPETRIIFSDTEKSNWAWDDVAKAYYWHRFFSHQPDLNHNNPHVVKAIMRVMRFWFDAGVDGMRLDAIPYLCLREGSSNENLPETHAVIRYLRSELDKHYKHRMLLAEANQWPEDVREYFGDGDECHMAYHFPLMPRLYMAIAQEDRHPIVEIMQQTPDIPDNCQWAIFLRNHDELTLEMVTDRERDYMYQMYATDPRARLNLGIRRRLAPLMGNNREKIELMNILLMTMPGSPILYYGDEIGMGDNIYLGDRNGVRTPMQWSPDRNAGFSRADPQRLYLPPIMDPVYGFESVNVEAQSRNASSLLNWMKRLIAARKVHPAFGRGSLEFLHPGNRKILAYLREFAEESVLCVANLSRTPQPVELNLSRYKGRVPVELVDRVPFPPIGELPYLLTLPGYGFYGFLLAAGTEVPHWHEEHVAPPEPPVLVFPEGLGTLFSRKTGSAPGVHHLTVRRSRERLESEVLPGYLAAQRWFAGKGAHVDQVKISEAGEWHTEQGSWLFALVEVQIYEQAPQLYALPLAIAWEDIGEERLRSFAPWTLAKVRQRARVGILFDALRDEAFCRAVVMGMGNGLEVSMGKGRLRFTSTSVYATLAEGALDSISYPSFEQSNTSVIFNEKLFLKAYRRLQQGIDPELEMGLFLTEIVQFPHVVPVAGALEYYDEEEGATTTLALLLAYVENQGSGWSYTQDYLARVFENAQTDIQGRETSSDSQHVAYLSLISMLGQRTGELHKALATPTINEDFVQEPMLQSDVGALTESVRKGIADTLNTLESRLPDLAEEARQKAEQVLERRQTLLDLVDDRKFVGLRAIRTRYHGDFHLGQVLLAKNDWVIIDFEGEPSRPLAERRRKDSPLRDVAGMLRSFSYAAAVAVNHATEQRPDQRGQLVRVADAWEKEAASTFLKGYREAVVGYPSTEGHAQALIELFILEKALYEVRYELESRPDWVSIPLSGLLSLL